MTPSMEPGLGSGVLEGARVSVGVSVNASVGVKMGECATVCVSVGCPGVGEASGSNVGEDHGAGCTDCVKTARVKATAVATAPELVPPGVAAPDKLQAHKHTVKRAETIIMNGLFIGKPPLEDLN